METHDYKGFTIVLEQDMDTVNPYDTGGNYYLCLRHRQYNLPHDLPGDFIGDDTAENLRAYFEANNYTYLPVYMLDHSGISLSTTPFANRWDSGLLGFIYLEPDELDMDNAEDYLKFCLDKFAQWLNGDIYVATITKDDTLYDCIGELYGADYALQYAKEIIDSFPPDDMNRNI